MKPENTAVLFIEFQNDFCKEGGKLYNAVKGEMARNHTIENAVSLLERVRRGGYKIIHVPFTLDKPWIAEHRCKGLLAGLAKDEIFMPGTWGHKIIDEMKPLEDELVLEGKRTLSAFSHTNLKYLLQFSGIHRVVVCGFLTNVCVQCTAISAYDAGYKTRIVPEACGATCEANQRYVEQQIVPILGGAMSVGDF